MHLKNVQASFLDRTDVAQELDGLSNWRQNDSAGLIRAVLLTCGAYIPPLFNTPPINIFG